MIDAVKMDDEEQSGHLAESEVTRLLAVLQNAEFKRSETRNIAKDHSFKPRSLMEIAFEAQQLDAEIEAVKQAEEALASAQRAQAPSASEVQGGKDQNLDDPNAANPDLDNQNLTMGRDNNGPLMPADRTENALGQIASPGSSPSPISDAAPNVTPDIAPDMVQNLGSSDQSSDAIGNPANEGLTDDSLANETAEHELTADNGDDDAVQVEQIAANFETVTSAFERGKAEGMIAGRDAGIDETKAAAEAAAQANLADKIAAFEAALVALAKPQSLQAEDLSRSIHAAILKLASQRAGQHIDDMPENFLARIEALVTSIGQKMTAGKVHINADDYRVMLPYLADTHFDFVAESGLARGDVILKFAGVELHDIAETRLGGQYAETSNSMIEAPMEAAGLELERISTEIQPTEIQPTETQPAETQPAETQPAETQPAETQPTETQPTETQPTETQPTETQPTETLPAETMPAETTQAESASKIRPMTTVRPLATNNDVTENDQDDQPPLPSDETSS